MISADKLRESNYQEFNEEQLDELLNSIEKILVRENSAGENNCFLYQDQLERKYSRPVMEAAVKKMTTLGYSVREPVDEPNAIWFIIW